jgi:hypothetical protein
MNDKKINIDITPETKVGTLLDSYPELEDLLVRLAPPFAKLRNPILRKTVARVTSLRQAAKVGGVNIAELVNALRKEVGLSGVAGISDDANGVSGPKPDWVESQIAESLDARPVIESGEQPIGLVMSRLRKLSDNQVFELITPFEPAPLMDKAREQGFSIWSEKMGVNLVKTYFCRVRK